MDVAVFAGDFISAHRGREQREEMGMPRLYTITATRWRGAGVAWRRQMNAGENSSALAFNKAGDAPAPVTKTWHRAGCCHKTTAHHDDISCGTSASCAARVRGRAARCGFQRCAKTSMGKTDGGAAHPQLRHLYSSAASCAATWFICARCGAATVAPCFALRILFTFSASYRLASRLRPYLIALSYVIAVLRHIYQRQT